jgi:CRP-like cAMP-binding protein
LIAASPAAKMAPMGTFVELASRTELFSGIDLGELEQLSRCIEPVAARPGQVLFREGDRPDGLYVIESGRIRIAKGQGDRPGTYARFLATLEPGEVFGEMALVLDAPRSATALADSDCALHRLSRSAFDELMGRRDHVAFQILRSLAAMACRRLERTCEGLVDLRQRVTPTDAAQLDAVQSRLFHRPTA